MLIVIALSTTRESAQNYVIEDTLDISLMENNIEQKDHTIKQNKIDEIDCAVPAGVDNSFKTYMDYRAITDKESKQWELQSKAYDDHNGIRKVGEYYCVALGTYYSENVGDKFRIELDNGNSINVIVGDIKSNSHTNGQNQYVELSNNRVNIIEFIVNLDKLDTTAKIMGDISYVEGDIFKGNIEKIIKLEER